MRRRTAAFAAALSLVLCCIAGTVWAQATAASTPARPPELVVEGPPSLGAVLDRVRAFDKSRLQSAMNLVGLRDGGPPIRVILEPEGRPLSRRVPDWVGGYAVASADTVVILPDRVPAYPDRNLEAVVQHEITHILIARAAGGRPVPRWLNEGMAMTAARAWALEDRARLFLGLADTHGAGLDQIDRAFYRGRGQVSSAYTISAALFRELANTAGPDAGARILAGLAQDRPFNEVFLDVTGTSPNRFASAFWKGQSRWYRWFPVIASDGAIWGGIVLIALAAFWRRRRLDQERMRQWEEEEEAAALAREQARLAAARAALGPPERFDSSTDLVN